MNHTLRNALIHAMLAMGGAAALSGAAQAQQAQSQSYRIPAGDLEKVLSQYGTSSRIQLIYPPDLLRGKRSDGLDGDYAPTEALRRLLQGSGLEAERVNNSTIILKKSSEAAKNAARASESSQSRDAGGGEKKITGMPAIMVEGSRTLNVDIERSVDDPQPYVIFDRTAIERSGAVDLGDFFRTRLPMNTQARAPLQVDDTNGNASGVNLRGLGQNQTLILIDGRRAAKSTLGPNSGQPDVNGIPLDAIERIEVLPTTASAIYGGSATGGVINIILRRDYIGTQVSMTYDNSFDTDSSIKRMDLSSGFSLFGGRSSVLLSGSYSESNALLAQDRDFERRNWDRILASDPSWARSNLVYGAAANIISANGTNLVMKDGTPLNAAYTSAPVGYGGIATDGGAALLANAGTYNTDSRIGNSSLTSTPRVKYFSASMRHEFSEILQGFLEASRSENDSRAGQSRGLTQQLLPASSPTNPFGQDVYISSPTRQFEGIMQSDSKYDRFGAGMVFNLPKGWVAAADYTLTKSERSFTRAIPWVNWAGLNAAIAAGTVDILGDIDARGEDLSPYVLTGISDKLLPLGVTTKNPAIRLGGPIGSLKAGRPRLSLLLERQDSTFEPGKSYRNGGVDMPSVIQHYPERTQKVDSAYLELTVPLVSALNNLSWVEDLELQLAGRWDKYSSVNADRVFEFPPGLQPPFSYVSNEVSKFSPLVALRFRPNGHLAFRASFGKGFLPPDINQLSAPSTNLGVSNFVDPRRGGTRMTSLIDVTAGGNPDLQPETSTTWSAGVILTPERWEGFRASLDYTYIEKEGNITTLTSQQILDNEDYYADRVTRGENLPGDPAGWAGPVTALDRSLINAASTKVESYDLQLDYTLYMPGRGNISLFAIATWLTQFDQQSAASLPVVDGLGWASSATPLDFRGNFGLTWSSEHWTLGWTARYTSSYYVADPASANSVYAFSVQGNGGRVPSQIYHDVFSKYQFARNGGNQSGPGLGLLDGTELQVGVRNITNKTPPYDYVDDYSPFGDPRLATYYITLRKRF